MLDFLKQVFTWWNGQTLNLRFHTWRNGEHVGDDEFGNRYYRQPSALPDSIPERRWVIYKNYAEASAIPPGWHGWMHHKTNVLPTHAKWQDREWQAHHQPNQTGTAGAYRPPGSLLNPTASGPAKPDYTAWTPE